MLGTNTSKFYLFVLGIIILICLFKKRNRLLENFETSDELLDKARDLYSSIRKRERDNLIKGIEIDDSLFEDYLKFEQVYMNFLIKNDNLKMVEKLIQKYQKMANKKESQNKILSAAEQAKIVMTARPMPRPTPDNPTPDVDSSTVTSKPLTGTGPATKAPYSKQPSTDDGTATKAPADSQDSGEHAGLPISVDGRCGPPFESRCPAGQCCSKLGWCGKSIEHCATEKRQDQKYHGKYSWQCLTGIDVPVRRNRDGNVECLSKNKRDCLWSGKCSSKIEEAINAYDVQPLTCGKDHKDIYKITGYDTNNHWCKISQKYFRDGVIPVDPLLLKFTGQAVSSKAVKTWAPAKPQIRFDFESTPKLINNINSKELPVTDGRYAGIGLRSGPAIVDVNGYKFKVTNVYYQTMSPTFNGVLFYTADSKIAQSEYDTLKNLGLENQNLEISVYADNS